jgi:uncharacterized membrane protein
MNKTYSLLAATIIFNSAGNVLLSQGVKSTGGLNSRRPEEVLKFFLQALGTGTIWVGIGLLVLFFITYLLVLSRADFSYVSPASAAGYALVVLLGYAVLGEHVTRTRSLGVALICAGVILVGRTPPSTTKGRE